MPILAYKRAACRAPEAPADSSLPREAFARACVWRRSRSSHGTKFKEAKVYRDETAKLIKEGRHRDAIAREIRDIRRAAAKASNDRIKYNDTVREMLQYAKSRGIVPARSPRRRQVHSSRERDGHTMSCNLISYEGLHGTPFGTLLNVAKERLGTTANEIRSENGKSQLTNGGRILQFD